MSWKSLIHAVENHTGPARASMIEEVFHQTSLKLWSPGLSPANVFSSVAHWENFRDSGGMGLLCKKALNSSTMVNDQYFSNFAQKALHRHLSFLIDAGRSRGRYIEIYSSDGTGVPLLRSQKYSD